MIRSQSEKSTPWPAVALFGAYWLLLLKHLSVHWTVNPQYSFGWLVPPLLAYLLWRRWRTRPDAEPARQTAAVCAVGVASLAFFPTWLTAQPNPDWRLVSWLLALEIVALSLAATHLAGGRAWLRHFAFPICFILAAVPWPYGPEQMLIQHLAQFVAAVTVELLNTVAIPAMREGNIIHISAGSLGVDDACSGVRSLQATFMASLFLGEMYRFHPARRALLLGVGLALALACNIGRAFLLAWVAAHRGIQSVSTIHDEAGFTIMTLCFLGAWGVALWLMRGRSEPPDTHPKITGRRLPGPVMAGLTACLVFTVTTTEAWYRWHETGEKIRWSFVCPSGRASFKEIQIPEVAAKGLQFDEGRAGQWSDGHESWLAFFFKWSAGPARSRILARTHRPEICLPASGFKMQADLGIVVVEAAGVPIPFHALTFTHDNREVYVFFCLWEDRGGAGGRAENTTGWNRLAGFESVRRGERNLGQQVLEIVLSGYANATEAQAALKRELPKLVKKS